MKNTNKMPFGYKANGEIELVEAGLIRSVFEVVNKYCDELPDELIAEIIEKYKEIYGEDLSYEEAKENVTPEMTKRLLNSELDNKWKEYLASRNKGAVSGSGR